MELVPDQKNGRLTAILLLVIALILVYLLAFHWFFQRHAADAEMLADLQQQLARFQAVASQREPLSAQLAEIRNSRGDAELFLPEENFNEAAAALSERLGQTVKTQADESCRIVSRQPVRARAEERYERVTVNVRMRCYGEDLLKVLYQLETGVPMVLIGDLNVLRPRATRRNRGANQPAPQQPLDVRFNMSGYLKQ